MSNPGKHPSRRTAGRTNRPVLTERLRCFHESWNLNFFDDVGRTSDRRGEDGIAPESLERKHNFQANVAHVSTLRKHSKKVYDAAWGGESKPETLVSVGQDRKVIFWEPKDRRWGYNEFKLSEDEGQEKLKTCCFLDKGLGNRLLLGSVGGYVGIYDADENRREGLAPLLKPKCHFGYTTSVAFVPKDTTKVVSSGADLVINVLDVNNLVSSQLYGHKAEVNSISMQESDPTRLVSASADKTCILWDTRTNEEQMTFEAHEGSVNSVSLAPDCQYFVSGSDDKTCRLFDIRTGSAISKYSSSKTGKKPVTAVCFSSDGSKIYANNGGKPVVWSRNEGKNVYDFMGKGQDLMFPKKEIVSISVSHSKTLIQTSSWDGLINIWEQQ